MGIKSNQPPGTKPKKLTVKKQTLRDLAVGSADKVVKGGGSYTTSGKVEDGSRYCVAMC